IAEPRPDGENLGAACPGQRRDGGEAAYEPGIVGEDRPDRGLLQHDFRDPDAVGVAAAPPRQIAPAPSVPGQQRRNQTQARASLFDHAADYNDGMAKEGGAAEGGSERPDVSVVRHSRSYRQNLYVYPVLSRRARGISI